MAHNAAPSLHCDESRDIVDLKRGIGVPVIAARLVSTTRIILESTTMNLIAPHFSLGVSVLPESDTIAIADHIEFSTGDCDLGKVLVARSSVGICAIQLGSSVEELEQSLAASFPNSRRVCNDPGLRGCLARVAQFIAAPGGELDFTLDIRGTAFQRRVWNALRTIPFGKPLTYSQLACRISEPKSLRAIGQACAENPIALAIPCHRVVGHCGSMAPWRWGAERKRALINREVMAV
jgi:O-6-methylguanine DNA methyltransferase